MLRPTNLGFWRFISDTAHRRFGLEYNFALAQRFYAQMHLQPRIITFQLPPHLHATWRNREVSGSITVLQQMQMFQFGIGQKQQRIIVDVLRRNRQNLIYIKYLLNNKRLIYKNGDSFGLTCRLINSPTCIMGQCVVVTFTRFSTRIFVQHASSTSSSKCFASKRSNTKSINFNVRRLRNLDKSSLRPLSN